jgi:Ca2+-binding RTX toxin-like protein
LGGNDTLTGGMGRDKLDGGTGNDKLYGGTGDDTLLGGAGTDLLVGGYGLDTLSGGSGNDTFKYASLAEISDKASGNADRITDMAVGDTIDISAIAGLKFVGVGNDFTGAGNEIRTLNGTLAIDVNGDKVQDYSLIVQGNPTLEETKPGSHIFQVPADLTLTGTAGNDTTALTGGNGNDTINGLAGNDVLTGGYGSDKLSGGDGNDKLVGGLGVDSLYGGAGNDTFLYNALAEISGDTVADMAVGDKLDLSAFAGLHFVGLGNGFSGVGNEIRETTRYDGATLLEIDANGDTFVDYSLALTGGPILEETQTGSLIFQVPADLTLSNCKKITCTTFMKLGGWCNSIRRGNLPSGF